MSSNNLARYLQTDHVTPVPVRPRRSFWDRCRQNARVGWLATAVLVTLLVVLLAGYTTHLAGETMSRCLP